MLQAAVQSTQTMEASTSTLWMAAEAIEAQTQLDDKVRALNLLESCGAVQARQAAQRLVRHGARPEDIALSLTLSRRARLSLNILIWAVVTVKN